MHFDYYGGQYIQNGLWHTHGTILQSTVAYLNITINVKPKTWNQRLEPMGQVNPGETWGLTGTDPGLIRQESAVWGFKQVWNGTDKFLQSKPGLLVSYPDLLLTLPSGYILRCPVLKSTSRGQIICSETILKLSRLWIWYSFRAIVLPGASKWYCNGIRWPGAGKRPFHVVLLATSHKSLAIILLYIYT